MGATGCVRAGANGLDRADRGVVQPDAAADGGDVGDLLTQDGLSEGVIDQTMPTEAGLPCSTACVLASGLARPFALAVVDARVYVIDFGDAQSALSWLPLAGGSPTQLGIAGAHVYSLMTDGVDLFWGQADGISRLPPSGGAPQPLAQTSEPRGVVLADGWVYWVRGDPNGGVYRVAKTGGTVETLYASTGGFQNLVVVGGMVYLTTGGSAGEIVRLPTSGGSPTTIASNQGGPWGIASNGKVVVWANHEANELVSYALPAGPAQVIASGVGGAHQVALVGDVVYATADTAGRVVRVRPGLPAEDLATGVGRPKNLVVVGDHVYFTDDQGGRVLRVAR